MAKNYSCAKGRKRASPSRLSQSKPFLVFPILPSEGVWFSSSPAGLGDSQAWSGPNEAARPRRVENSGIRESCLERDLQDVKSEPRGYSSSINIAPSSITGSSHTVMKLWQAQSQCFSSFLPISASRELFMGCASVVSLAPFGVSVA